MLEFGVYIKLIQLRKPFDFSKVHNSLFICIVLLTLISNHLQNCQCIWKICENLCSPHQTLSCCTQTHNFNISYQTCMTINILLYFASWVMTIFFSLFTLSVILIFFICFWFLVYITKLQQIQKIAKRLSLLWNEFFYYWKVLWM